MGEFVYIMGNRRRHCYKVGRTKQIHNRMKSLQTGCPFKLQLILAIECEDAGKGESLLHTLLKGFHSHGEWFVCDANVIRKAEFELSMFALSEVDPSVASLAGKVWRQDKKTGAIGLWN